MKQLLGKMEEVPQESAAVLNFKKKSANPIPNALQWIVRIAAVLLISIISFRTVQTIFFQNITVKTQLAEKKTVNLSDGSVVEMNAESKLIYSKNSRQVDLHGEAFFLVTPSQEPFVVTSGGAKVTVLGTEFNVKARESTVTLVVEHGKVSFGTVPGSGQVLVEDAQMSQLQLGSSPSPAQDVDLSKYLAWREGRIEFEQTLLVEVFDELRRQFAVDFQFRDIHLNNRTLTASFDANEKIEDVVSSICLTFSWEFERTNDLLVIQTLGATP